jgi:hypothetical protein
MDDKELQEWVDRNEEFQREASAIDRRRENMKRILEATRSLDRQTLGCGL